MRARILSALVAGLLGGATAAAVWIALNWSFGISRTHPLPDWTPLTAGLLGGGGFIYGAMGGAYLGRRRAGLAFWMLGGGLLTGLLGMAIARFGAHDPFSGSAILIPAAGGVLLGFFARLVPVRACAPDALRFSLLRLLVRLAPVFTVSVAFIGAALWVREYTVTLVLGGIGLLGLSLMWALAWQERHIMQLEKKLKRLSDSH